jgi:NADH-quinone oxidoreductase subunit E
MDKLNIKNETIKIVQKYRPEKRFILAMLQDIQKQFNYLPKESMEITAEYADIPLNKVFSIATFYKAFSLKPKGKNIIKLCNGTACHVKGAVNLIQEVKNMLNIMPGETTEDKEFSLEIVNCIGACGLAPVAVINDEYYGNLTADSFREIIVSYRGRREDE